MEASTVGVSSIWSRFFRNPSTSMSNFSPRAKKASTHFRPSGPPASIFRGRTLPAISKNTFWDVHKFIGKGSSRAKSTPRSSNCIKSNDSGFDRKAHGGHDRASGGTCNRALSYQVARPHVSTSRTSARTRSKSGWSSSNAQRKSVLASTSRRRLQRHRQGRAQMLQEPHQRQIVLVDFMVHVPSSRPRACASAA